MSLTDENRYDLDVGVVFRLTLMNDPQVPLTAERTFHATALKYSGYSPWTSDETVFPSATNSEGHNYSRE
jgi:hypothetical protein